MLQFTFLGTSSGVPTLIRNVSGLAVKQKNHKDWILIDAGEGTQHQIQKAKLSLQHLKAICITHVHGDHCYGLPGLLASAGMNSRRLPMTIIAPIEIQQWFEITCKLTDLHLPYTIEFVDVHSLDQPLAITPTLSIQTHPLHHRVPSYAFSVIASEHQRKLNTQYLYEQGIEKGKLWGELQQGQDIVWQGRTIYQQDAVETQTHRLHAIIAGDNDQPELLHQACQTADILIHETTYTQTVLDKVGAAPMHSSAKMVAEFAQSVQLKNLIATHISARFHAQADLHTLHQEILQSYSGQFFIAEDLAQYELDIQGKLSQLNTQQNK